MTRNYRKEYDNYQGKPEQKKNRAMRNAARREAEKQGRAKKGDGKDVHHVVPIAKGGKNTPGNTMVTSRSNNRSFARTSKAKMR
jgi:hypothetical protein